MLLFCFVGSCAAGFVLPLSVADLAKPPVLVRAVSLGIVVLGTLVAVSLHEWAHAVVAYRGGDQSVADKGYLTLDFRRYSDPLLSIGMPVLFVLMGFLPLPGGAVWINRNALRSRWWRTAVSLAGSMMNLGVGLVAAVVVSSGVLGTEHAVLTGALAYLALIMFGVTVLNLLPIPGLDGYSAVEPHLPLGVQKGLGSLQRYGLLLILGLMLLGYLDFIWNAALGLSDALGVDRNWIAVGATLARIQG